MEMKIVQDTKNEVLNRRELVAEIEEKTIPSRDEVRAKLATMTQTDEKTLIIQKIDSSFGNPKVTIRAHAYDDEESMKRIEKEYFLKRNFPVVEKAEEAAATKAPVEATPAEASKEKSATTESAPADETTVEETKAEEVATPVEKPKAEEAPTEPAKEEPKTGTAPVEEKKEEAPAEEKKDDAPTENKKEDPKTKEAVSSKSEDIAPAPVDGTAEEKKKEGEQ